MTEKERMTAGKLYFSGDPELTAARARTARLLRQINITAQPEERPALFRQLLGALGERSWLNAPFYCDYGGNISIGHHFYANYDCIILDVCPVTIGDNVFFAPRVCVFTAAHPIDAEIRNTELEFGKPVTIGSNVWVGGNSVINPGVTIGDNVVIGSGSVVTKDIPSGVVAAGNPCRVLRPITREDHEYWQALAEAYRREQGQ